jgi:hypothetical protein
MVEDIAMASAKELKGRNETSAVGPLVPTRAVGLWALVVAVAGVLLYVQTLSYDYAMDDYSVIVENVITRQGSQAVGEIMTTAYRHGHSSGSDGLYRPISKAVFAVLWGMGDGSPAPMHAVNVLMYALTGALAFLVLYHWLGGHLAGALFGAVLFIGMPIHTEVVANIKSLDEILALFGFLWASLALWRREQEPTFLKDARRRPRMRLVDVVEGIRDHLPASLSGGALRVRALERRSRVRGVDPVLPRRRSVPADAHDRPALGTASSFDPSDNFLVALEPLERIPTAISIVGRYLTQMLAPTSLTFDASLQQIPVVGFGSFAALASLVVLLGMGALAVLGLRTRSVFGFAMLAWFSTASVSSNLVMLIGTNYGERLMYAPSFGIAMAVGCLLARTWRVGEGDTGLRRHVVAAVLVAATLVAWSVVTVRRNPVWADNNALYESGVVTAPNSMRTQFYLGNHLHEGGAPRQVPEGGTPADPRARDAGARRSRSRCGRSSPNRTCSSASSLGARRTTRRPSATTKTPS